MWPFRIVDANLTRILPLQTDPVENTATGMGFRYKRRARRMSFVSPQLEKEMLDEAHYGMEN